jgi:hypothetical protein
VVEFVSTEHTPRNVLLRAVRRRGPPPSAAAQARGAADYAALAQAWGVVPHLQDLLQQQGCLPEALLGRGEQQEGQQQQGG